MRLPIRVFFLVLFLFLSCESEHRRKLVVLESGVNVNETLRPFLCKIGHKSHLPGKPWDVDETGHGTAVVEILSQTLNPKIHCILILKTTDGKSRAEEYATALIDLTSVDFDVLLLALEDKSYYYKEVGWLDNLASKSQIVVAAGNDGIELREDSCEVFPACLKYKLKNKKRFHVVSGLGFNRGPLVEFRQEPCHKNTCGSSFSAARFAGQLFEKK